MGTDTGLITVGADGTVGYDRAAFDFLGAGQHAVYTIGSDVKSGSDVVHQTVTLTIDGENDGLTARADTATTDEDHGVRVAVLANDTDPDTSDT